MTKVKDLKEFIDKLPDIPPAVKIYVGVHPSVFDRLTAKKVFSRFLGPGQAIFEYNNKRLIITEVSNLT